jgi:hypothetical protein
MTVLLTADVVLLEGDRMCDAAGNVLAVVDARGLGRTRLIARAVHGWVFYQKRGLGPLSHHLTVRTLDGTALFDIDKKHDRVWRRIRTVVTGPDGRPLGRVERSRFRLRFVAADGTPPATLKGGSVIDDPGHTVARIGRTHRDGRTPCQVSFSEPAELLRPLVLSHAVVSFTR